MRASEQPERSVAEHIHGFRIVLADDHPLVRKAIGEVASAVSPGTLVDEVDSLAGLLDYLAHNPETDMILLDLHLPDCSGFAGIRTLREKYPAIPVVVISAMHEQQMMSRSIELGASAFIPKSTPLVDIQKAIAAVFDGEIWLPPRGTGPSSARGRDMLTDLTPAQVKIVSCLERGLLNKQIAYEMGVTEYTVKAHMTAAFRKLGVSNRTQAMVVLRSMDLDS